MREVDLFSINRQVYGTLVKSGDWGGVGWGWGGVGMENKNTSWE